MKLLFILCCTFFVGCGACERTSTKVCEWAVDTDSGKVVKYCYYVQQDSCYPAP